MTTQAHPANADPLAHIPADLRAQMRSVVRSERIGGELHEFVVDVVPCLACGEPVETQEPSDILSWYCDAEASPACYAAQTEHARLSVRAAFDALATLVAEHEARQRAAA